MPIVSHVWQTCFNLTFSHMEYSSQDMRCEALFFEWNINHDVQPLHKSDELLRLPVPCAGSLSDIQQPCRRLLVPGKLECRNQQLVPWSLGANPRVPSAVRAGIRSSWTPRPDHLLAPAVWAGSNSADNALPRQSAVDPHAHVDASTISESLPCHMPISHSLADRASAAAN